MTSWNRRLASVVAIGVVAGCSGGTMNGGDADGGDGADGFGMDIPTPEPPNIPWLDAGQPPIEPPAPPVLTPCPEGWREVTDPESGTVTCDPWPETGYEECTAVDEAHFPGEPGCTRIGTACSADDDWATDLPTDQPVRYVLAGAPVGGDGTRAAPFATIREAMHGAGSGTVIAAGKGRYDETISVAGGVTLWGACVAETVIAPSTSGSPAILVSRPRADVKNLRIGGGRPGLKVQSGTGGLHLEDVLIAGVTTSGIEVRDGGTLDAQSLVVRDTRPDVGSTQSGRGIVVLVGGRATLTRMVAERNWDVAVSAWDAGTTLALVDAVVRETAMHDEATMGGRGLMAGAGAEVSVASSVFERNEDAAISFWDSGTTGSFEDVVIRDTIAIDGGTAGRGLDVGLGSAVTGCRVLVERNREHAVLVWSEGSSLSLADTVVRETAPVADGTLGRGLSVAGPGSVVHAVRLLAQRNRDVALAVTGTGSSFVGEDVILRDTTPILDGTAGRGLDVGPAATASIARMVVERNRESGVFVFGAGSSLSLFDAVVQDTDDPRAGAGCGVVLLDGAHSEISRAVVRGNRWVGLLAQGPGSVLEVEDIVVRDTQGQRTDLRFGRGLAAIEGATVTMNRTWCIENKEIAVSAEDEGTTLNLEDVVIEETATQESDGRFGEGLTVKAGAHVVGARIAVRANHETGVMALGPGSTMTLVDLAVIDTHARECWIEPCASSPAGFGLAVYGGAGADLTRFQLMGSSMCGLQLAHGREESGERFPVGGTIDLHDGEVSFNTVCGANVQTEGFDLNRLMDNVLFHDNNGVNLDMTELPVPEVGTPLEE